MLCKKEYRLKLITVTKLYKLTIYISPSGYYACKLNLGILPREETCCNFEPPLSRCTSMLATRKPQA